MNELIIIIGMALVTIAIRYPLLALLGKLSLPEPIFRALKYVPPAVLTAIIMPAMLFKNDVLVISGVAQQKSATDDCNRNGLIVGVALAALDTFTGVNGATPYSTG